MKERIYVVKQGGEVVALVRAKLRGQAIRHVTRDSYSASVATQDMLIDATKRGIEVQDAAVEAVVPPQA